MSFFRYDIIDPIGDRQTSNFLFVRIRKFLVRIVEKNVSTRMDWCNETKVDDRSSLCPTNRRAMMDYGIHAVRVDFYLYIYPFAPLCQLPTDVASQRLSFSGSNLSLPSFIPKYLISLKFLWEFSYSSLSILYFIDPKRNSRKEEKEDENEFVRVK